MARIKEVKIVSDKYEHVLMKKLNEMCKKHNVQNINVTRNEVNFFVAFVMIGTNEDMGKKKK